MKNDNRVDRSASRFGRLAWLCMLALSVTAAAQRQAHAQGTPDFGPNVAIIDPTMSTTAIQAALNAANQEIQFSANRHAVLFMPGTYNGINAQIGYYESVAGLGQSPRDVIINGALMSNTTDPNGNVTVNFWRAIENMSINYASTLQWAVSQGAQFRRMNINGALQLTNTSCGQASGGFIADSIIAGNVNSCSQQQWYMRNSAISSWSGNLWNMVFSGVQGAPAPNYPSKSYTVLPTTPVAREKPYLYVDDGGNFNVFVPASQIASAGASWANSATPGYAIPLSHFLIATPATSLAAINAALALGKHLLLTPGVYQYAGAINVTNPNTIVFGLGYATLVPQTGTAAITVADVDGVQVTGLIIDAGPVNSPVLLQVGTAGAPAAHHAGNPTAISDTTFRIGGASAGAAATSLAVDSHDVILDNIWGWRADHGNGFGWSTNVANHGVVVTGDNVTALGLAVEHYQQEQVLWKGNGGQTIFYQSELPYDVPSQAAWSQGSVNGYPSYVVASTVTSHAGYGMGVYSFFNQGVNIIEDRAISVPDTAGVSITDAVSVFLSGSGSINATVNTAGTPAKSGAITSYVAFYQGAACSIACPATPANVQALAVAPNQVNVSWSASSAPDVLYSVYRSTSFGFTPSAANRVASGLAGSAFADAALNAGTSYYYLVQANSHAGTSPLSTQAGATTPTSTITTVLTAIDAGYTGTNPPAGWSAEKFLTTSGTIASSVTSAISLPAAVAGAAPNIVPALFQTYRHAAAFTYTIPGQTPGGVYIVDLLFAENFSGGNKVGYRQFNVAINGKAALTNYDIFAATGAVNAATLQSFYAVADAGGVITIAFTSGAANSPTLNGIVIGTSSSMPTPPAPPANLVANVDSDRQITLNWGASATSGVQYALFRGATATFTPGPANLLATTSSTNFTDNSVTPSATYYYVVVANNGTMTSASSNQVAATSNATAAVPSAVPAAPTELAVTAVSSAQITLLWRGSATPQVHYTVFRSTASAFTPSAANLIATTDATGYTDGGPGLAPATKYYYVIVANNALGASPASTMGSAITKAATAQTLTFAAPPLALSYGAAPITLDAGASSGLPVQLSVVGPATVNGTLLTITGAGTVVVTAAQAGNATFSAAAPVQHTIAVAPAPLRVQADNVSIAAGAAVPVLTASYSGFVNGDNVAAISGTPALSTAASAASTAGIYPITAAQGTLWAANYSPTFVNGTLSVVAGPSGGAPALSLAPALVKTSAGFQASITITNNGGGDAINVTLGTANLGAAGASSLPLNVGTIAAGASARVTVSFAASAGASGATVLARFAGSYMGGSFTSGARTVLP